MSIDGLSAFEIARKKKTEAKMRGAEQILQEQVVHFLAMKYPDALFTASAGGMRTSIGTARKMKRAGYKRGTPDLMIFSPRSGKSGLAIELKTETGRLSPEQKEWLTALESCGWVARACFGLDDAEKTIDEYFGDKK